MLKHRLAVVVALLATSAATGFSIGAFHGAIWVAPLVALVVLFVSLVRITYLRDGGIASWQPQILAVVFLSATFIARPIQLLWSGKGSLWQSHDEFTAALPAATLAVLTFVASAVAAFAFTSRRRGPLPRVAVRWSARELRQAAILAVTAAFVSLLLVAGSLEGIVGLVMNSFGRRSLLESQFYLLLPIYGLVAIALFVVAGFAQGRIGVVGLIVTIVFCFAMLLPLGGRGEFLKLGLMCMATWQAFSRRIRPPAMVLAVVAAYLVISVGFAFRLTTGPAEQAGRERLEAVSLRPTALVPSVVRDGFTGFDRLAFALPRIPEQVPYQGWTTVGRLAVAPVPRALWPEKPGLSEATVTARLFGTDVGRYPITVVGQAWLQAGVMGLLLMGCLQGLLWSFIRHRMFVATVASSRVACVVASVTLFGGLDNLSIVQFLMRVIPVVVIGTFLERTVDPSRLRRDRFSRRIEEVSPVLAR